MSNKKSLPLEGTDRTHKVVRCPSGEDKVSPKATDEVLFFQFNSVRIYSYQSLLVQVADSTFK